MARIALIEDSSLMRTVFRQMLEKGGHVVEEWESGSAMEILQYAERSHVDLLITDYKMPGANGATVAKMARKAKPTLPIIVITSLRDAEVMEILQRCEVNAILNKPCTEKELLDLVAKTLGN